MLSAIRRISTLRNHYGFRRYAVNTSWMLAEQLLRIVAGLFVGVWVARYLGPEQFGLFSYVVAFTAIFGSAAKLGLDGIMVRELVNQPEMRDKYLGTAFCLKAGGAFLVIALIAMIVPFTSNDAITNLYIFIIAAGLVFQSFEVVEFYFQSQVLAKIISFCKFIQLALSSIIKVYLVLTQAELIWFVVITAFDAMSLAICYFIAYRFRESTSFYNRFDPKVARSLLRDSWPLISSSIVVMIYMRIDQIMIKEMLGSYEVGIYSAAVRLSEIFYLIPTIITASVFPAVLNARREDIALYKLRVQRLLTALLWMAILIALLVTVLAGWIVCLIFGEEYRESSHVLVIHIWGLLFVCLGVASGKWLLAENLNIVAMKRTAIGALINVALNFWAIPNYGTVGAAVATLISQSFAAFFYDILDKKTRDMFILKACAFALRMK